MTQKIEIGVNGDASGAEKAMAGAAKAVEGIADALGKVDAAGQKAGATLDQVQRSAEQLKSVQAMLSRELGRPISPADTDRFIENFERLKRGRNMVGRQLRAFEGPEQWYYGHRTMYRRPGDAARHRGYVISAGMQNTQDSHDNGAPPAEDGDGEDREGGGGGRGLGRLRKAGSTAMGIVKGGLALAGISSVLGMLGKGLNAAVEEAIGTDTLKRRMGDLGVEFGKLRDQARYAGEGLGVTYVESNRLALQYAQEAGMLTSADAGTLGSQVRVGIGLSRAYGLDPSQGVGFFGSMRRMGLAGDDQQSRRLALLIADAVAKGGFSGKVDEILGAIQNYATQTARLTLSRPNVDAYASALASLMNPAIPGLDPAGAAAILGSADTAMRQGGAYGQASKNFTYMALANSIPGLTPITAEGLQEGGIFGTTAGLFDPDHSALGAYYKRHHIKAPAASDTTNIERILPKIMQQYGPVFGLDALKNYFGLGSIEQAAALSNLRDRGVLGGSAKLIHAAHLDPANIAASGLATIGDLAAAKDDRAVAGIYQEVYGRKDMTADEKAKLTTEFTKATSTEGRKEAIAKAVAGKEMALTEGAQTRKSLADLDNTLTQVGHELLAPLNVIRDTIVMIAEHAPFIDKKSRERLQDEVNAASGRDFQKEAMTAGGTAAAALAQDEAGDRRALSDALKKGGLGGVDADSILGKGGHDWTDPTYSTARRQQLLKSIAAKKSDEIAAVRYFEKQGWTLNQSASIVGNLMQESGLDPTAIGDKGAARGLGQWHADRWARFVKFAKAKGLNVNDYNAQLQFVQHELMTTHKRAATALRGTDDTVKGPYVVAKYYEAPKVIDGNRAAYADGAAKVAAGKQPGDQKFTHHVHVTHDSPTVTIKHPGGKVTADLRPVAEAAPSGTTWTLH